MDMDLLRQAGRYMNETVEEDTVLDELSSNIDETEVETEGEEIDEEEVDEGLRDLLKRKTPEEKAKAKQAKSQKKLAKATKKHSKAVNKQMSTLDALQAKMLAQAGA